MWPKNKCMVKGKVVNSTQNSKVHKLLTNQSIYSFQEHNYYLRETTHHVWHLEVAIGEYNSIGGCCHG